MAHKIVSDVIIYGSKGAFTRVFNTDESAALQITSTSQAFLPPRMTTAERDAITSPTSGLLIWNVTTVDLEDYNGAAWSSVGAAGAGTGDLKADGSVPMVGDWDFGDQALINVSGIAIGSDTFQGSESLFNQGSAIISGTVGLHDAVLMGEAPTLDQMNTAISGFIPYWEHNWGDFTTDSITSRNLFYEGALTAAFIKAPIANDSTISKIAVVNHHSNGSDPGDWDLQVRKHPNTIDPVVTFQYEHDASNSVEKITVGAPAIYSGVNTWFAGEMMEVSISGATITGHLAINVIIGFESI